jgi:ribonuclease VapC
VWRAAVDAWLRFGKGRHHAALNFGDCISYATVKLARLALLFVGDDFAHTDIEAA